MALTLGTMFTTEEALKIGLIDEIAKDKTELIQKCENFIGKFKKIPPIARAYSKQVRKLMRAKIRGVKLSLLKKLINLLISLKLKNILIQFNEFPTPENLFN